MATTSNFGWNTPDDTDLVKDGALAIRTLGNNIDTSLVDLKGGTTGQILSKNSNTDLDYTWINNDQGDITEVQAGTGISVASGTGPVPVITNTVATEFDAKGDLVVGTGADTFDKLTAGADGETLVADSSTTTGLRWQADWNVGKNKIINGDFFINQRAFSSTTTNGGYGFDRWVLLTQGTGGTTTYSAQTFTPGSAPVAGYEARNFARIQTASFTGTNTLVQLDQRIEDVRTFAGQNIVVSFWAKANSGTPNILAYVSQNFGSGGSPSSDVLTSAAAVQTINQAWARYSFTISVPSISGKTIGTNANTSYLGVRILVAAGTDFAAPYQNVTVQNNTFDIWGVQVEAGSVATPFTTATGTLAGELAACQRYYQVLCPTGTNNRYILNVNAYNSTSVYGVYNQKVSMRTAPTLSIVTGTNYYAVEGNATADACDSFALGAGGVEQSFLQVTSGVAVTQGYAYWLRTNDNAAFAALQAEL